MLLHCNLQKANLVPQTTHIHCNDVGGTMAPTSLFCHMEVVCSLERCLHDVTVRWLNDAYPLSQTTYLRNTHTINDVNTSL